MSRLQQVIDSVRDGKPVEKVEERPRLSKSISLARAALSKRTHGDLLEKGVHDAMAHHAVHARAAHSACYKAGPHDPEHDKKCKEHGKEHEYRFMRHALEHAKKKARYSGDMKYKMQNALQYFDSDAGYDEADPEYKKAHEHYKGGGDFKHHKDDKEVV